MQLLHEHKEYVQIRSSFVTALAGHTLLQTPRGEQEASAQPAVATRFDGLFLQFVQQLLGCLIVPSQGKGIGQHSFCVDVGDVVDCSLQAA